MEAIYICQTEDGELFADFKTGIDLQIKQSEQDDEDLNFKVIGKVKGQHVAIDFNSANIEWYEKGEKDKAFIDKAVLQIVQFIGGPRSLNSF